MKKQLILILGVLCMTASLLGCGGSNTNTINSKEDAAVINQEEVKDKTDNPEEYIQNMYTKLMNKEITYEDMWDDYISDTFKNGGIIDKKTCIENSEAYEFKNNLVYTEVKAISSEQVTDNIFKVRTMLRFTANGQEMSNDYFEYVINENGNLKCIPEGKLSLKEIGNSVIENINYNNIKKINYVEGLGIIMDIENKYDNAIELGGFGNYPTIILKTDKGEYTSTLNPIKIGRGQTQTIEIKFEEAQGEIESITINNINYLNDRGLPQDHTGGASHTLQL